MTIADSHYATSPSYTGANYASTQEMQDQYGERFLPFGVYMGSLRPYLSKVGATAHPAQALLRRYSIATQLLRHYSGMTQVKAATAPAHARQRKLSMSRFVFYN